MPCSRLAARFIPALVSSVLGLILPLRAAGPAAAQKSPDEELQSLTVPEDMELGLFASQPLITSPAAIVVDSHGRVWVAGWATHGPPTTGNAHPHVDQSGKIALIHNGIIENAGAIKKVLEQRGHTFKSATDTEVLAHLVGVCYRGSLEEAVAEALREVDGAYGIAVICSDEPDVLVAARKGSPLLVGVGDGEWFVASDASAILSHTRSVVYLDDGEMVVLTRKGYHVRDLAATRIEKPVNQIEWDLATIERGGYAHFMLKEIFEQPDTVRNTMRGHLLEEEGTARVSGLNRMSATALIRSLPRMLSCSSR